MWYWLTWLLLFHGISACSTITQWRQRSMIARIDRIFSDCEAKRGDGQANWTDTVRCGNDGVQDLIEQNGSPYAGLIEAALASRLTLTQQIEAGAVSIEDGQGRLTVLDIHIHALPGSMMELLSMTAAVNPP